MMKRKVLPERTELHVLMNKAASLRTKKERNEAWQKTVVPFMAQHPILHSEIAFFDQLTPELAAMRNWKD